MTVAHQAALSMGFPRQESWSGLPFSSPEDLLDPGIKPAAPALQADSSLLSHLGSYIYIYTHIHTHIEREREISVTSHASKVVLKKFSKPGFNSTWTVNFPMFNLDLENAKEHQRSNCQHLLDHWKSKRVPEKHLLLIYWLCQSLWLCGSQQTVEHT